jgi:hypothetical protein
MIIPYVSVAARSYVVIQRVSGIASPSHSERCWCPHRKIKNKELKFCKFIVKSVHCACLKFQTSLFILDFTFFTQRINLHYILEITETNFAILRTPIWIQRVQINQNWLQWVLWASGQHLFSFFLDSVITLNAKGTYKHVFFHFLYYCT